jgi:type I restriction enzyme, S subunit
MVSKNLKTKQVQEFKETEIGKIPVDWDVKKISEIDASKKGVQTGPFGSLLHSHDYLEHGYPLILVKHVKDGFIVEENLPKIGETKYLELSKFILKEGDIIFTRVGYVGNTAYVEKKHAGWLFSGQTLRIRLDNPIINNRFVSYFFLTENFKNIASSVVLGSTRDSINTQILKDISIPIPPIDEQEKIVSIIISLINKIQNLQNQNNILEQIAQTIFKSWFVDFNGVTEFDDSELGKIPKGWSVKSIGDLAKFNPENIGNNFKFSEINYIDTSSVSEGKLIEIQKLDKKIAPSRAKRLVKENDIIISTVRPNLKHFYFIKNSQENTVVSTGFVVIRSTKISPFYLYRFLTTPSFIEYLTGVAESHTSTYPSFPPKIIEDVKICMPDEYSDKKFQNFDRVLIPIHEKLDSNAIQITALTRTRDILLPKLISGEIRV